MASKRNLRVKVQGVADLLASLEQFKQGVRNRVTRAALSAAATPVLGAIKANAPRESGLLKKSIGRKSWVGKKGNTVAIILGPRRGMKAPVTMKRGWMKGRTRVEDPVFISHLVEAGTRPHPITFKKGKRAGQTVRHPGLQGRFFVRKAWESTRGQAQSIMRSKLAEGIQREAAKAAKRKKK